MNDGPHRRRINHLAMSTSTQTGAAQVLLRWIEEQGGYVHPALHLAIDDQTGLSVFTTEALDSETRLFSCPFKICVTPAVARTGICAFAKVEEDRLRLPGGAAWSERMVLGAYLSLHWLDAASKALRHREYVEALPPRDGLRSPLQFTPVELDLLAGTNLLGATRDKEAQLRSELTQVQTVLPTITWEDYRDACTYISSRAFPSALLNLPASGSQSTSAVQTSPEEESHPILIPGIDLFNHARAQPITWLSSRTSGRSGSGPTPTVSLVAASGIAAGSQVFNNYGPRSNEELLLAYGFVIPDNPDDTVVLRLGGGVSPEKQQRLSASGLDASERFFLRRDGQIPDALVGVMRILLAPEGDSDSDSIETELDAVGELGGMLEDKLEKLTAGTHGRNGEVRGEVRSLIEEYKRGQQEILEAALDGLAARIEDLESRML